MTGAFGIGLAFSQPFHIGPIIGGMVLLVFGWIGNQVAMELFSRDKPKVIGYKLTSNILIKVNENYGEKFPESRRCVRGTHLEEKENE